MRSFKGGDYCSKSSDKKASQEEYKTFVSVSLVASNTAVQYVAVMTVILNTDSALITVLCFFIFLFIAYIAVTFIFWVFLNEISWTYDAWVHFNDSKVGKIEEV